MAAAEFSRVFLQNKALRAIVMQNFLENLFEIRSRDLAPLFLGCDRSFVHLVYRIDVLQPVFLSNVFTYRSLKTIRRFAEFLF